MAALGGGHQEQLVQTLASLALHGRVKPGMEGDGWPGHFARNAAAALQPST